MSEALEREAWELNKPGADKEVADELNAIGETIKAEPPQPEPKEKSLDDDLGELVTAEQKRITEGRDRIASEYRMLWGSDGDIARAEDFLHYYGTDAKLSVRYLLTEMEMRRNQIVSEINPGSKFHNNPYVLDSFRNNLESYITEYKWITPDMTFPDAITALEEKEEELKEDIEAATHTAQT